MLLLLSYAGPVVSDGTLFSYESARAPSFSAAGLGTDIYPSPGLPETMEGVCFEAGTLVATARGGVPIETVRVGDLAFAADPETGQTGYFTVTAVFSRHVSSLLEVVIDGELIRVTEEHPFWVIGEGWVSAEDLEPGDCVQTLEGTCRAVVGVQTVPADTWVYNFTVAEAHTYFVAGGGYLVHNQCNMTGAVMSEAEALDAAISWLGENYYELAPGVFRSRTYPDRQFRMTTVDLTDSRQGSHVHFDYTFAV
jgi:hypothetical protein